MNTATRFYNLAETIFPARKLASNPAPRLLPVVEEPYSSALAGVYDDVGAIDDSDALEAILSMT